jgi:hypothetical protein
MLQHFGKSASLQQLLPISSLPLSNFRLPKIRHCAFLRVNQFQLHNSFFLRNKGTSFERHVHHTTIGPRVLTLTCYINFGRCHINLNVMKCFVQHSLVSPKIVAYNFCCVQYLYSHATLITCIQAQSVIFKNYGLHKATIDHMLTYCI